MILPLDISFRQILFSTESTVNVNIIGQKAAKLPKEKLYRSQIVQILYIISYSQDSQQT